MGRAAFVARQRRKVRDVRFPAADGAATASLPTRVHLEVPHFSGAAGGADQWSAVDDETASDAHLAGDIHEVLHADAGSPGVLGQGAEIRLIGDRYG